MGIQFVRIERKDEETIMNVDALKCLKKRFENLPDYALSEEYDKEIIRLIDDEINRATARQTREDDDDE